MIILGWIVGVICIPLGALAGWVIVGDLTDKRRQP
jgi:hypothetical protein